MLGLSKNILIEVLTGLINGSNQTKCMSLSNLKCMILASLINLHHTVKCFTDIDFQLSNKVCVPNKIEVLNLSMFNMITRTDELKILTNRISCECKWKFRWRKCNSNQWWNNNKRRRGCKKHHICEKRLYLKWKICKNGKYLASITDDSVVTCDEIIEGKTKTITKKFIEKNALCKTKNFCILLASWLLQYW